VLTFVWVGGLRADTDIFSINFYGYGTLPSIDYDTVTIDAGESAGLAPWNTTVWDNVLVPGGSLSSPLSPVSITSVNGVTATFTFNDVRNGGPRLWNTAHSNLAGDANADLMDGGAAGTEDPYDESNFFDVTISNLPYESNDVIVYMLARSAQFGSGTGKLMLNNGVVREFSVISGEFAAFMDMVDSTTPGNYLVLQDVPGPSFNLKVWGDDFNHLGPSGIQVVQNLVDDDEYEPELLNVFENRFEWTTGVEASDGYLLGSFSFDSNGWEISSSNVVIANSEASDDQMIKMSGSSETPEYLEKKIYFPNTKYVWLEFDAKISDPGSNLEGDTISLFQSDPLGEQLALFKFTPQGTLTGFNGNTEIWEDTTVPVEVNEWHRYELFMDFESNIWHLMVDGTLIFKYLGFVNQEPTDFSSFGVSTNSTLCLDNISILIYPNDPYNSTYTGWLYDYGISAFSNNIGLFEDFDNDSQLNCFEYAFMTSPFSNTDANAYASQLNFFNDSSSNHAQLNYLIRDDDPQLYLDLKVSSDLQLWKNIDEMMVKSHADIVDPEDNTREVTWQSLESIFVEKKLFLQTGINYENGTDHTLFVDTNSIIASGDTFVRNGVFASDAIGDTLAEKNILRVQKQNALTDDFQTLMKFDLEAFSEPVTKAILIITVDEAADLTGFSDIEHNLYVGSNDNWSEGTLTWNDLIHEAKDPEFYGEQIGSPLAVWSEMYEGKRIKVDITDAINAVINDSEDQVITFIITAPNMYETTSKRVSYISKDNIDEIYRSPIIQVSDGSTQTYLETSQIIEDIKSQKSPSISSGTLSNGSLANSAAMPLPDGDGYVVVRPWRPSYYGHDRLIYGLLELGSKMHEVLGSGDEHRFNIYDISNINGEDIIGHLNHEMGLDVDLSFYITDPEGNPVPVPLGSYVPRKFDENGISELEEDFGDRTYRAHFDAKRNWHFVKYMLLNDTFGEIRSILIAEWLKSLILKEAEKELYDLIYFDPEKVPMQEALIEKAKGLLRQPSSSPHANHYHLSLKNLD